MRHRRGSSRPWCSVLPRPAPQGRPFSSFVLAGVMLRLGQHEAAGLYAAEGYAIHRTPMLAVQVARSAAALGDRPTAVAWLRTAARDAHPVALKAAVDGAGEFDAMRADPAFAEALHT